MNSPKNVLPAIYRAKSTDGTVVEGRYGMYVVDPDGQIRDYATRQQVTALVVYALTMSAALTNKDPEIERLKQTVAELAQSSALSLGTLYASLTGAEANGQLRLYGWPQAGWLVDYDPAVHGETVG